MAENRFSVLYSFYLNDGKEIEFIDTWTKLTKLIYKHEGSYGSRLHKVNDQLYIGYAQWPNKSVWEQSGDHLPEDAAGLRQQMRACCNEIKTEYELEVVVDLIKNERYE